jgi:carbonic anhydrase
MAQLSHLFENNRTWASGIEAAQPGFFERLSKQQTPDYLWIGCSDSLVPANEIVGLLPGELFVHRNVANLVVHTDLNCLSVLRYAVEVLKVRHIIVCGHYGCGGVHAAMADQSHGLVDNWLRHIQDLYRRHDELAGIKDETRRADRLCELNVMEQALNVSRTTVVREVWRNGQALTIHGWIYSISNGLLRDLGISLSGLQEVKAADSRLTLPC